jgi:hypothetical protein
MAKNQPHIKAALSPHPDGDRIVLWIKNTPREDFPDMLVKVRAIHGTRFDWDEKVWHMPLTRPNADRVLALASHENVEIAPALGAWMADRAFLERIVALEAGLAAVRQHLGLDVPDPERQADELLRALTPGEADKPPF